MRTPEELAVLLLSYIGGCSGQVVATVRYYLTERARREQPAVEVQPCWPAVQDYLLKEAHRARPFFVIAPPALLFSAIDYGPVTPYESDTFNWLSAMQLRLDEDAWHCISALPSHWADDLRADRASIYGQPVRLDEVDAYCFANAVSMDLARPECDCDWPLYNHGIYAANEAERLALELFERAETISGVGGDVLVVESRDRRAAKLKQRVRRAVSTIQPQGLQRALAEHVHPTHKHLKKLLIVLVGDRIGMNNAEIYATWKREGLVEPFWATGETEVKNGERQVRELRAKTKKLVKRR